jgi:hypothetical protein
LVIARRHKKTDAQGKIETNLASLVTQTKEGSSAWTIFKLDDFQTFFVTFTKR